MSFLVLLLAVVVPFFVIQLRFVYRRRRLLSQTWGMVLDRVEYVNFRGVKAIADRYLQPDHEQLRLSPGEMWEMVGGLVGVGRMRANAEAMLDLAVFAEQWNAGEGPVVSEMIRRDGVRLKRAVTQIQLAYLYRVGFVRTPFHVQEAAAAYYLMRSRLIGLYQNSQMTLVPRLEAVL
jgi:hypothetical protein